MHWTMVPYAYGIMCILINLVSLPEHNYYCDGLLRCRQTKLKYALIHYVL